MRSILLFVLGMLFVGFAHAEPLAVAKVQGVTITMHSEACTIPQVANLAKRATWLENGKLFEGCWGASPVGVVMLYFHEDRTVGAVPTNMFVRVTSVQS